MRTTKRLFVAALAVVSLLGFVRESRAADLVRVSGGIGNMLAWTDSFDELQESDRLLVANIRVGVGVWEGLSVELGYRHLEGDGQAFPEWNTATALDVVDLGARYDYFLLSWLSAYGRAGASFAHATVDIERGALRMEPSAMTGGLFGALGLSARLPRSWFGGVDDAKGGRGFTFGFQFDVGYGWFGDMGLSGKAHLDGGIEGMKQASIDLGELSLHGLTYAFSVALHL